MPPPPVPKKPSVRPLNCVYRLDMPQSPLVAGVAATAVIYVQAPKAKAAESLLKRDTPFIATIRFRNDLPELPCDPKVLLSRLDTTKLSQFGLTQMELALKLDVIGAQDPSSIPLIDLQRFCPAGGGAELDAEDRALIDGQSSLKARGDVSWLMRTKCGSLTLLPLSWHCVRRDSSRLMPQPNPQVGA